MIRILHLIPSFGMGGAEGNLARLVSHMDNARFSNTVVVMGELPGLCSQFTRTGVTFHCLGMRMRRGPGDLVAIARLFRIIKETQPHVLQTWLYYADLLGLLVGKLSKVPVIAWNVRRSFVGMSEHGPLPALVLRALVKLSPLPDVVVTNSLEGWRSHAALGYHPRRWVRIPNSLDLDRFRPKPNARIEMRRELMLAANAPLIGMVARHSPIKGHDTFVTAAGLLAKQNSDVHFILLGRGMEPHNTLLMRMLDSNGVVERFHLLGERENVDYITSSFDIACSASYGEGFPNTVVEAMACGVPCVVTDVGDSAQLVEGNGKVVPPGNPQAFARACQELLSIPDEERKTIGINARKSAQQRFSIGSMVTQYEKLYEELTSR